MTIYRSKFVWAINGYKESGISMKRQTPEDPLIGQKVGMLKVLRRLDDARSDSKNLRAQVLVQCDCGTRLKLPRYYLIRKPNPKQHCGCQGGPQSKRVAKNTIEYKPEYICWKMMLARCYDTTHVSYNDYGGRGIKVFTDWANLTTGFEAFLKYVGLRPSMQHTLDRIDNDGHYVPGNVRWATPTEQANNRGRSNG